MEKWGYIRETPKQVDKAFKNNPNCEVGYTCIADYLKVIFPDVDDWILRKTLKGVNGKSISRYMPDLLSPSLKLIIEIDGLPHYTNPENIIKDREKDIEYANLGYEVVRIPYFIQLNRRSVKTLFDIEVDEELFNIRHPSLGVKWKNTPAYLCPMGIRRMMEEFNQFPDQYIVNYNALKAESDQELSGIEFLRSPLCEK